ncbi:MAG: hypothetical protein KDD44_01505, partial [Bdellovibrionales bacterium]|nr:hypothetical protein [Bdellovibrionales bacterium]
SNGKNAQPMDVGSTMVGVQASAALRASFAVLDGKRKGERFILEGDQTMIGSDPGCAICIDEKKVPPRYALVIQRGSDFTVAPLSPEPVVVNGEASKGAEEISLKRGDTLRVGSNSLRFIAPGEVFTLQDNIADRVVDRPKSKFNVVLTTIAVVIIALCAIGGYSYYDAVSKRQARAAKSERATAEERKVAIAKLLRQGDEFLKAGALIEPPGENARERFQQILELDPDHTYAKRRMAEIEERVDQLQAQRLEQEQLQARIAGLMADAERMMAAGELVSPPGHNAKQMFEEILRLDPNNAAATAKLQEISSMMGDMADRVHILFARAQVYYELGQWVRPRGENVYEMLEEVYRLDPDNTLAIESILDLAALVVFRLDQNLAEWDLDAAGNELDTALALKVNPEFLASRRERMRLMGISKRGTIIPPSPADTRDYSESDKQFNSLNTGEIQRRLAKLRLKSRRGDWQDFQLSFESGM